MDLMSWGLSFFFSQWGRVARLPFSTKNSSINHVPRGHRTRLKMEQESNYLGGVRCGIFMFPERGNRGGRGEGS